MFGGWKFNKNSELLREAEAGKSNSESTINSVNDGLFMKINDAEHHARLIMQTGQAQYIGGIKQNILDGIRLWLDSEYGNVFTLYGKMGCGKSFFSAHLWGCMEQEKDRYNTVAFSSQQLYQDTTQVRNMLLSLAHQLFLTVPACSDYFSRHPLDSESIASLTEDTLIAPFEGAALAKKVFIIIDGLDEYPRHDCEAFLETLSRLRGRLHRNVKIFFTSRPEDYIMSEMICDGEHCSYHIERNTQQSTEDCARFINAKCAKAGLEIDEAWKQTLIQKSECSLKYLECFFNEVALQKIAVTADFIEDLPIGLSHYYRDQLVRYFGDESLDFYKSRIVPLLELLCVAWRPITMDEASDILGYRERDIQDIINRSGTLLWRNNRYVMLYQSESIREFLIDDRCCPEKYRIDRDNGHQRILDRLERMMDCGEELESNMYLFHCAVEHILSRERVTNVQWALLRRLIASYADKADVTFKISRRLLERSVGELVTFLRQLYADRNISPLLQDICSIRLISAAVAEQQIEKLTNLADMLDGPEQFDFFVTYSRAKIYRAQQKNKETADLLEPRRDVIGDDPISLTRHTYYMDELCRIYRTVDLVSWEEITDLHLLVLQEAEQLAQAFRQMDGPVAMVQQRNLVVTYDQAGRLCESLEKQVDPTTRQACGKKLLPYLNLTEADIAKPGFFLLAAETFYQKDLKLSKYCQQSDAFSDSRIYDLHFCFYALGILYFRKDFPAYNPDKALQYFEDCLSALSEIALRPESHDRFIKAAVKLNNKLTNLYLQENDFAAARKYLTETARLRELRALYHPSANSEFDRCLSYEQEADIKKAEMGIAEAEAYYLTAIEHYKKCMQKYSDRFVLRSCQVVYFKLAKAFKQAGNWEKYIAYTRLELTEMERVYSQYPSNVLRWDWGVTLEYLANALRKTDPQGTIAQRLEMMETALSFELEVAESAPQNRKYRYGPSITYYYLLTDYLEVNRIADASVCLEKALNLAEEMAQQAPEYANRLDIPVRMFILLYAKLNDKDALNNILGDTEDYRKFTADDTMQKYLDAVDRYIDLIEPYCVKEDCSQVFTYFLDIQAKHMEKTQGIEAAEPCYLKLIRIAKEHAGFHPSESNFMLTISGYSNLYLGFNKIRKFKKAFAYLQEELQLLDGYLKEIPDSIQMQKLRGILYKLMGDALKDSSSEKELDAAADLYMMSLKQHVILWTSATDAADKDNFIKLFRGAYQDFTTFLRQQEYVVSASLSFEGVSREKLLGYLRRLVSAYSFLSELRLENSQEKLEKYVALLKKMEEQ